MKNKTLIVEAIENGTVLDHIPAGQALPILHHFHLDKLGDRVTVGFNLNSHQDVKKDIIKIEGVYFTSEEAGRLALFAPTVTVNIIENFQVTSKLRPETPDHINGVFECPNSNCASHGEPVQSIFYVQHLHDITKLKCHYCEKNFQLDWVMND